MEIARVNSYENSSETRIKKAENVSPKKEVGDLPLQMPNGPNFSSPVALTGKDFRKTKRGSQSERGRT